MKLSFLSIFGGGAGIWTFMAGYFCGRSGLSQLGVVPVSHCFISCSVLFQQWYVTWNNVIYYYAYCDYKHVYENKTRVCRTGAIKSNLTLLIQRVIMLASCHRSVWSWKHCLIFHSATFCWLTSGICWVRNELPNLRREKKTLFRPVIGNGCICLRGVLMVKTQSMMNCISKRSVSV